MRNINLILIAVFIAMFFASSSCKKKNKWKLPTDVSFKMDINRSTGSGGNLTFTGGTIILGNFTFDGKRDQGDDVYFSNSYENGLSISFGPNNSVAVLDFDIPQGTYKKITISFETFDDEDGQIVVTGTYKNSVSGTTNPIRFEFEEKEYYTVVSKDVSGNSEIVLDKDVPATATITLDPIYWFQTVSTSAMDNATLVNVSGVPTILINDDDNEDIFDLVDDRIDDATKVVFD